MHDDTEDGFWAIVADAGGKKYIGTIVAEGDVPLADPLDIAGAVTDGVPIRIREAWSVIEMDLVIPGPQGPQGIQHMTHARPANNCQGPCSFLLVPTMVHLFTDMTEEDRRRNKALVDQANENCMRNRAGKANITLAGPGALPPGRGFHGPGSPPGLS
jgi:hypothetical protein